MLQASLMMDLTRKPFDAQAHAITGIVKGWRQSKSIILCAEMGTGKTMMGILRPTPTSAVSLTVLPHAKSLRLPGLTQLSKNLLQRPDSLDILHLLRRASCLYFLGT